MTKYNRLDFFYEELHLEDLMPRTPSLEIAKLMRFVNLAGFGARQSYLET